ncbi:DUF3068 domain-containing protein [Nocardia sp. NPDC127579]|uniref:DUF3068 domain-containing protein n=1 Tax=Nocardia sp. NPDC127579 TaxID=3345402 RepID=UPI0036411916
MSTSRSHPRAALAAIGLGVALGVIAIAFPVYVEPHALKVPLTIQASSTATGTATIVDAAAVIREKKVVSRRVPVRATQRVSVIEPSDDDIMTIQTAHRISRDDIGDPQGATLTAAVTQITVDRRTGYPKPGTAAKIFTKADAEAESLVVDGLHFKFPFETKAGPYRFFDHTAHNSYTMEFQSAEEVDGLEVYHFKSETPVVTIGGGVSLPAEHFGGNVGDRLTANRYYHAVRDLWVEPRTGLIVDARQSARQYVAPDPNSRHRVTLIEVDAGWDEATRTEQFASATEAKALIQWGLRRAPWLAGLAAAASLALGVIGLRRRRAS